jgi:NTP pyrophosphatase (non-canonical NTP hydrolase)
MKERISDVIKWGDERGITFSANIQAQALKVVEEIGETVEACHNNDTEEVMDGIGDSLVTLILLSKQVEYDFEISLLYLSAKPFFKKNECLVNLCIFNGRLCKAVLKSYRGEIVKNIENLVCVLFDLAYHYNTSLEECLDLAWEEIKDRKGKTVAGTFIKE